MLPLVASAQYTGGQEDGYAMAFFSAAVTNIDEQDKLSFAVYPNPVSQEERLIIEGEFKEKEVEIIITDISGREVLIRKAEVQGGKTIIEIRALAAGTYILCIRDKRSSYKKIHVN